MKERITKYLKKNFYCLLIPILSYGIIHAINLDDGRIDPFDEIEDFESVVYIKIGNASLYRCLNKHRTILNSCALLDRRRRS